MITNPENVVSLFKAVIEEGLVDSRVQSRTEGYLNPVTQNCLWLKVTRDAFHRSVAFLKDISPIHVACPVASREHDEGLELIYPFTLFSGGGGYKELPVIISVILAWDDLTIRTVTDLIPGILYMEREMQEMLGVVVEDIPDGRRLFTPDSLQWRKPFRKGGFEGPDAAPQTGE